MGLKFLILGEYNLFVWSAFLFTFIICLFLYLKTRKEFKQQEKMFSKELEQINVKKADVTQEKEVLVGKTIF